MSTGDVVIVGAGPAGVRAAQALVEAGLRPVVVDEAARVGGQIYRQPPPGFVRTSRALYGLEHAKAEAVHRAFDGLGDAVVHLPGTLAWDCQPGRLSLLSDGRHRTQPFSRLILCTGAMDRVLPFPGWLLPGVYTLGAAQVALKAQGCVLAGRVVLAGSGPLLYLVAYQVAQAGADVVAVLDASPSAARVRAVPRLARRPVTLAKGLYYLAWLRRRGVRVVDGVDGIAVSGSDRVTGLAWRRGAREEHVDCDAVATGFGLRAETQLADLAGCAFDFEPLQRQWLPRRDAAGRSSVPGVYLAGDGAGILGADAAEVAGRRAALALLEDVGRGVPHAEIRRLERTLRRHRAFQHGLADAFPLPTSWAAACGDGVAICRCEDISAGELRQAASRGDAVEINRLKALTRVGMGRCQGRVCAGAAAEILACSVGVRVEDVGRLRAQAPIKPIPLVPTERAA